MALSIVILNKIPFTNSCTVFPCKEILAHLSCPVIWQTLLSLAVIFSNNYRSFIIFMRRSHRLKKLQLLAARYKLLEKKLSIFFSIIIIILMNFLFLNVLNFVIIKAYVIFYTSYTCNNNRPATACMLKL